MRGRLRLLRRWLADRDRDRVFLTGVAAGMPEGERLTIELHAGAMVKNDVLQLWFPGGAETAPATAADLVIREAHPFVSRPAAGMLVHQTLVDSHIDLSRGFDHWFDGTLGDTTRKKFRRSVNAGHKILWTESPDWIARFHAELLIPSTLQLHGDRASLPPVAYFVEQRRPDCLLIVTDSQETPLGGLYILKSDHSPWRLLRLGLTPAVVADPKLRSNISTHLYVESLRAAAVAGQAVVSLGLAPAAEAHGLWHHKQTLGARPAPPLADYPRCLVRALTPRGERALKALRLFVIDGGTVRPFGAPGPEDAAATARTA